MAVQGPAYLDRSWGVDSATGMTTANLAVIASTVNAGNAMLAPVAGTGLAFLGFTLEFPQASAYGVSNISVTLEIMVRMLGIAQAISDGAGTITSGCYVIPSSTTAGNVVQGAGTSGIATTATADTPIQIYGISMNTVAATAGLLADVFICPWVTG